MTTKPRDLSKADPIGAFGSEGRNRMHPTQKPVALLAEIIERWVTAEGLVADPFLGSGSTLLACETSGRRCAGIEIDPAYCDVIVSRWEKLTSGKAQR